MVKFVRGDLFAGDMEAIVNTVNRVGVMGRGIALQFKKYYPDNFKAYKTACKRKEVITGKCSYLKLIAL
jgi:O-acetyl-ADP-ribose deacetylase (regulator of RNase III)